MKSLAQHTFWIFGVSAMFASMSLVGCGSSSTGTVDPNGGVTPITGLYACTGATPINTTYGCLPIYSCQGGTGWLAAEARCVAPIPGGSGVPGVSANGRFVTISGLSFNADGRRTFELMLQNAGLCSPALHSVWYFGDQSCRTYSGAGYMQLQISGATGQTIPPQGTVVIGAGASAPNMPNNSGWTTAVLRHTFYSNLSLTNGNQGFTGTGPLGFRFVVNSGFPGSSYQMSVDLQYNGVTFARGNLVAQ